MKINSYTTFNNSAPTTVIMNSVSHVIADKENGSWVWFISGKCIHVVETLQEVTDDLNDYYDTVK